MGEFFRGFPDRTEYLVINISIFILSLFIAKDLPYYSTTHILTQSEINHAVLVRSLLITIGPCIACALTVLRTRVLKWSLNKIIIFGVWAIIPLIGIIAIVVVGFYKTPSVNA